MVKLVQCVFGQAESWKVKRGKGDHWWDGDSTILEKWRATATTNAWDHGENCDQIEDRTKTSRLPSCRQFASGPQQFTQNQNSARRTDRRLTRSGRNHLQIAAKAVDSLADAFRYSSGIKNEEKKDQVPRAQRGWHGWREQTNHSRAVRNRSIQYVCYKLDYQPEQYLSDERDQQTNGNGVNQLGKAASFAEIWACNYEKTGKGKTEYNGNPLRNQYQINNATSGRPSKWALILQTRVQKMQSCDKGPRGRNTCDQICWKGWFRPSSWSCGKFQQRDAQHGKRNPRNECWKRIDIENGWACQDNETEWV